MHIALTPPWAFPAYVIAYSAVCDQPGELAEKDGRTPRRVPQYLKVDPAFAEEDAATSISFESSRRACAELPADRRGNHSFRWRHRHARCSL